MSDRKRARKSYADYEDINYKRKRKENDYDEERRSSLNSYYKRGRNDSSSSSSYNHKHSRKKHEDDVLKIKTLNDFLNIRSEIRGFLEEHLNIKQPNDFWQFFEKYEQALRLRGSSSENPEKLCYFSYSIPIGELYDKLPLFTRNSEKLIIDFKEFKQFILTTKTYQDFTQKTKFSRLKKLKDSQKALPIYERKDELIEALKTKRVILIAGDTGCGKSTQVPQYIMNAGYKRIVCTQPRRIACVSLSKRVAYESLNTFTDLIGYQIRFEKTKKAATKVIFMTEGLLLRHTNDEDTLKSYDVIILDEVHERHLNSDFLIGIMKCLLHSFSSNFKLILMSATINLELFKNYFEQDNLHVIKVPGRLFPIDVKYFPVIKDPYDKRQSKFDAQPYLKIIELIDSKYTCKEKGDLLIFLNGYSEISSLADAIQEYADAHKNWIVLMLHSSLSLEEQDKVFDYPPENYRKCIISTNIAETSVTIDGIRFVIDSGKVNRMIYTGGVNKLQEVQISQDSAKQRAGRAGRTGPGICYRLYSEQEYERFEAFTPAEIHLVPLENLLLNMVSLGVKDIENFPFLEKPDVNSIEKSLEKLTFIGALTHIQNTSFYNEQKDELNLSECENEKEGLQLSPLGEALSKLPVDLTIGKMLITSTIFGNIDSILILAALLSVQNPVTQQNSRNIEAMELLQTLDSNHGDPISLLNYFREWLMIKQATSVQQQQQNKFNKHETENSRKWCKKRGLEEQRFYEATKLYSQFYNILVEAKLIKSKITEESNAAERAIRKGELKQLKGLSYKLKNEQKTTKRKYLKNRNYDDEEEDAGGKSGDLKDVEFRILNDSKMINKIIDNLSITSYKNLMVIKLILSCGLYPQFSIEDEFNSSKTVSEKLFHTKNKNYVFLRPNSYFALKYEVLELHNDDIEVPPPGYFNKRPLSEKHQLLVYQTILETKKVYLVNTMRMPALHTLLLFSKIIACNASLTKFVFDDFLMIHVPYFGQGKTILQKVVRLRKLWDDELKRKLTALDSTQFEIRTDLLNDLLDFMQLRIVYNIKRLLPADLKLLYNSNSEFFEIEKPHDPKINPFDSSYELRENVKFGGMQVSENLIYNCLVQEEWEYDILEKVLGQLYDCSYCLNSVMVSSFFEILQHEAICLNKKEEGRDKDVVCKEKRMVKSNSKEFSCPNCNKTLMLTPVEILRHKKNCVSST